MSAEQGLILWLSDMWTILTGDIITSCAVATLLIFQTHFRVSVCVCVSE